jgi:hypothetical protein
MRKGQRHFEGFFTDGLEPCVSRPAPEPVVLDVLLSEGVPEVFMPKALSKGYESDFSTRSLFC